MTKKQAFIHLIRRTAFSSLLDSCITISIVVVTAFLSVSVFKWLVFVANWDAVIQNVPLYAFGIFPSQERWRPALWLFLLILLTILTFFGARWSRIYKFLPLAWIGIIPLGVLLLAGGFGLLPVASRYWGGLTLTIFLMTCSSSLAFPLGIILALGRQSELPLIRRLSSIYIDAIRSVPLIAILFFGQLLIPLFLPIGLEINRVIRAVLAFTLFVSAYVAEDIRGGLQSIPTSQEEAAKTLGLSELQITRFVILPQALIIALPALTNQAIGLLQNTSLMAILGLVELLGISRSILANPMFIGRYIEVYVWLAAIYWIVCTVMALLAKHLEKKLIVDKLSTSYK